MDTQIIQLVNRMKWLKKDSSEDDQTTNAESHPESEQPIEQVEVDNSNPEALEQPDMMPEPVSPDEETEDVPEEEQPEEIPAQLESGW